MLVTAITFKKFKESRVIFVSSGPSPPTTSVSGNVSAAPTSAVQDWALHQCVTGTVQWFNN